MLPHLDFKIPVGVANVDRASGKCIGDRCVQLIVGANLLNCRDRGREIGPIAREDRRASPDLSPPGRRIAVGTEVVVEPPGSQALPGLTIPSVLMIDYSTERSCWALSIAISRSSS